MAYNKTKWINNQTKLSATNFNHMEQGIEDAHILTEEAGTQALLAQTMAREAKEAAEHIDLSSKQDVLVSQVNIKSINGQSILGEGDLVIKEDEDVNYQELATGSLNTLIETGIYKITQASDIPEGTAAEGTLSVTKLNDTKVNQVWQSSLNNAQRILDTTSGTTNIFKVNGITVPQGEVQLPACGTYELQGNLIGHIVIGNNEAKDTLNNRTKIILNGVNIRSDVNDAAINYTPRDKKLVVELKDTTENYLFVNVDEESADEDLGAINSNNGLVINGVGYLTVKNIKGHGFKASELYIDGDPHIYVDANHDAFHGKNLLKITNGYFYVENCNDAFTAGHDEAEDDGRLYIYGGEFHIQNTKEAAFEGRSSIAKKRILNAEIYIGEGVNTVVDNHSASEAYQIKFYQGTNGIYGATVTQVDPATDFGPATVLCDGEVVAPLGDTYTLTSDKKEKDGGKVYSISGNFSNYKIVTETGIGGPYININARHVYFKNDLLADPFINHTTAKRIKIATTEDNLIYIEKAAGTAIKTATNIQITGKGDLVINGCGTADCGIDAENGYVLLKGDGLRAIRRCDVGVIADNVRLGEDPEDILDNKYGLSDDPIYLNTNTANIKVTNKGDLPEFNGRILATQYHTGISIIGNITRETANTQVIVEAQSGIVNQDSPKTSFNNAATIYITENNFTNIGTHNYVLPVGVKQVIPPIDPSQGSPWNVYKGDGYSKSEADDRFVAQVAYDALLAELDAKSPRKINIVGFRPDPTKEDGRPAKDHAYCPVDISGETTYIVDSVEIYRYACPEQIDIDSTVDTQGLDVLEPETHLSFYKDGRQIYARDGDFGYPEIDGTGQFNFKPVFNTPGYVLRPVVTKTDGSPAVAGEDYNKFKTPWDTGLAGVYRFTKIKKDIVINLQAVLENSIATNTITYKIIAPADYDAAKIPSVRVFRCSDQAEKYYKYYLKPNSYKTLDPTLMEGKVLSFVKQETEVGADQEWRATGISYDDATGYPLASKAKVTFLIDDSNLESGYTATASATGKFKNLNPGDYGSTLTLTNITGNVTVTITIAPPAAIEYDNNGHAVYDENEKLVYGFDPENPSTTSQGSAFVFTIVHNEPGYYKDGKDAEGNDIIKKPDGTLPTKADALRYLEEIWVNEDIVNKETAIVKVAYTAKKVKLTFNGEIIDGDIELKLAERPTPEVEPEE